MVRKLSEIPVTHSSWLAGVIDLYPKGLLVLAKPV